MDLANKNGYVTSYNVDICESYEMWHYHMMNKNKEYIDYTWPDHVQFGIACDPVNYPANNLYGMLKGPFGITKRCFMKD